MKKMVDARQADRKALFFTFIRYSLVGTMTGLLYVLIIYVLLEKSGWPVVAASATAYIAAAAVNFFGQKLFSFRSRAPIKKEIFPYAALVVANILMTSGIIHLLRDYMGLPLYVPAGLIFILSPILNFLGMKFLVFIHTENK